MRCRLIGVLLAVMTASSALAYSFQVTKVTDFPTSFRSLALVTPAGPAGFDTIWLEEVLVAKLTARKIVVVPASTVRQAMLDLEIYEIDDTSRSALAEKLGVDAFLLTAVDTVGKETQATVGSWAFGFFTVVPSTKQSGSVQAVIVSAKGKVLMQAAAFGASELRSRRGVIGTMFDGIFNRAFDGVYQFWAKKHREATSE